MATSYDYYPLALKVIDLIGQGKTRTWACNECRIAVGTFDKLVRSDTSLAELYVDAEKRGYDCMVDTVININKPYLPDGSQNPNVESNPAMAKVISDNIKWAVERRDPARYGQRVEHRHEVTLDRAIIDALSAGRQRALDRIADPLLLPLPSQVEDVVDAEYEVVEHEDEMAVFMREAGF